MATDFDVKAELTIEARRARDTLQQVGDQLGVIGRMIRGVGGSGGVLSGMVRSTLALGASYVGIQALAGSFRALVSGAGAYESQMQTTEVGLATVMSAVEHIPFEDARLRAAGLFDQLQTDAAASVATTQELSEIFTGIYGPIRAAGFGVQQIRDLTRQAATAGTALGIDLPQVSRDIGLMARGTAGMHARLFASMRSMGLIREDAQAFNALTQPERIERIVAALGQFEEAGAAFGHTLPGLTSTFTDLMQILRRAAFRPIFTVLQENLSEINDRLMANREGLSAALEAMGARAAAVLGRWTSAALDGIEYVATHWDEITKRMQSMVAAVRRVLPHLMQIARAFIAVQIGRQILGAGLGAGGMLLRGGGGLVAALGMQTATGAGAAGAAGGTALAASLPGILAALGAAALVVIPAIVAVTGVLVFVRRYWDGITAALSPLQPMLGVIMDAFDGMGEMFGRFLMPMLRMVGLVLANAVVPPLILLLVPLRALAGLFGLLGPSLDTTADALEDFTTRFTFAILEQWRQLAHMVGGIFGDTSFEASIARAQRELREAASANMGADGTEPAVASVVNDFRGSHISVRQEFRDADPDRVLQDMMHDIQAAAERRTQSGFVPALTR